MDCQMGYRGWKSHGRRAVGVIYGFGNQVLFLITAWYLFWFLRDGHLQEGRAATSPLSHAQSWIISNSFLAIVFAISHSLMLMPRARRFLTRWIPNPFYDTTFCVVTCLSLLLLFFKWQPSDTVFWDLHGLPERLVRLCFYLSWGALFYALAWTGLGFQNGWTPFYHWLRKRNPPRRAFVTKGAYAYLRHPVYLSFLGLLWFTPRMSFDRAILTGLWTTYIFYGSVLKDRRLIYFLGDTYREYAARVPGYPLMPGGPLARMQNKFSPPAHEPVAPPQPAVKGASTI